MANEDVILRATEKTRESLTEKLEALEDKVTSTVQEATSAVTETVEAVKEGVEETMSTVSESVKEGVATVKNWFDMKEHVRDYPWLMMAGSVAVGIFLEKMVGGMMPTAPKAAAMEPLTHAPARAHHTNGGARERRRHESHGLLSQLGPELNKLKGLAVGAALGAVRDMVVQALPGQAGEKLGEIIDTATTKMGGQPMPGSMFSKPEGETHEQPQRGQPQVGRPMGSTRWQG